MIQEEAWLIAIESEVWPILGFWVQIIDCRSAASISCLAARGRLELWKLKRNRLKVTVVG